MIRQLIQHILLGGFLLTGLSCSGKVVRKQARLPNVIYIMADDLGYGSLGSYGQKLIRTPYLDQMAKEGIRFTKFYAGSTVCAPSRSTLLTGLSTAQSVVRGNQEYGGFRDEEERGQFPLPPGTETVARFLKQYDYTTGLIGKWGLGGPQTTGIPNLHGFDFFYGFLDQKQAHNFYPSHFWRNQTWEATKNGYFSPHQKLQGDPADPAAYALFKGMDYATDMFGAEALRFIEAHQEQPFFLYLPYTAPHLALQAPDEAIAEYEGIFEEIPYIGDKGYLPHPKPKAAYAAMITRMDQQIGKMLQLLKKLDLDQNTLVIFTSDNGASFKMGGFDPDFFEANGPLRGYKQDLLEGGIRVPFIARWPGVIAPNTTSDHVAANWDVFATVAELIQKPLRNVQEGVSFLPLLTGIGIQQTHEWLYWEFPEVKNGIQAVRWGKWKGIRTGWMKNPDAPIALYNLDTDLAELHDVAAQHPDVVAFLKTLLAKRKTAALSNWNPSY